MEIIEIMKKNSLNKLMAFSLDLLLSIDLSMALASMHPKPVNLDKFKNNIFLSIRLYKSRIISFGATRKARSYQFLRTVWNFQKDIFIDKDFHFALN
jgi:hypothetical protein